MTERDLSPQLHDARVIAHSWTMRSLPWLREDYLSACNLAIAQALRRPEDGRDFGGLCRCLMHRRCTDVFREYFGGTRFYLGEREYRRRARPREVAWDSGSVADHDRSMEDPYVPDDTAWQVARAVEVIRTLPGRHLAPQRSVDGVLLYLELRSMEAVAERMGVTESRVSQYLAEVGRGVRAA